MRKVVCKVFCRGEREADYQRRFFRRTFSRKLFEGFYKHYNEIRFKVSCVFYLHIVLYLLHITVFHSTSSISFTSFFSKKFF